MTLIQFPLPSLPAPAAPTAGSSATSTGGATAPSSAADAEETAESGSEQTDFAAMLAAFVAPLVAPAPAQTPEPTPVVDASAALAVAIATTPAPVVAAAIPAAPALVVTAAPAVVTTPVITEPVVEAPPVQIDAAPGPAEPVVEAPRVQSATPDLPDAAEVAAPSPLVREAVVHEEPVAPASGADESQFIVRSVAPTVDDAPAPIESAPSATTVEAAAPALAERPADVAPAAADDVAPVPVASTPTSAVRSTAMATPIAAAAEPAPARPTVHLPIVTAVAPLVQRGDGSYQVSVRLHPEELGAVDIDVELRSGEINLRMRADNDAGRDAIRAALPTLRSELEAAGVRAGTFDLGDRPAGHGPEERHQPMPTPRHEALPDGSPEPDEDVAGDTALDVRL